MVRDRVAFVRVHDKQGTGSGSCLHYVRDEERKTLVSLAFVSGAAHSRDMGEIVGAPAEVRTMTFANTVKRVGDMAFYHVTDLRAVVMNEGLEELGVIAFSGSGLRKVRVPPGVRSLIFSTFSSC